MRNKRLKSSALFLLSFGLTGLQAQESINAAAGMATGSDGSVNYSAGQVVYQTHTGTNGSVAEGIQQFIEIFVVTEIEEAKGINLLVSAYPNPTVDYITLEVKNNALSNLIYQLYDMQGKLLQSEQIKSYRTNIAVSGLVPATYFMKIILENKQIKTFTIIKK